MAQDEFEEGCGDGVGLRDVIECGVQHPVCMHGTLAECTRAEDEFGAIAISEQCVSDAVRCAHDAFFAGAKGVGFGDARKNAVCEGAEELLFAREVPVESAGLHGEFGGQSTHGEVGKAYVVKELEGGIEYGLAVVSRVARGRHGHSILNAVHVNTVQVWWCSAPRWSLSERTSMSSSPRFEARDLARIAVFAAVIIALGAVVIPLPSGIPITGQTLGVMLAGAVLGPRRGVYAVLTVLALCAVGLPVLAGGRGGIGTFVSPTAGYLLGWVVAAFVIGAIAHRGSRIVWWRIALGSVLGGIILMYLCGVPVQALVTGMGLGPAALSSLPFLPGDLIKVAVTTILTVALYRAYPRAFGLAPAETTRLSPQTASASDIESSVSR